MVSATAAWSSSRRFLHIVRPATKPAASSETSSRSTLIRNWRLVNCVTPEEHGVLLAGVTGLLQFQLLGNVNPLLAGSVLLGSMPGSILGVYLSKHLLSVGLRRILCALVVALGARMALDIFCGAIDCAKCRKADQARLVPRTTPKQKSASRWFLAAPVIAGDWTYS